MQVTAHLVQAHKTRTVNLPERSTGFDLLRHLALAPDAHLLVRGESPIPLDAALLDREHLRVLAVVSGG